MGVRRDARVALGLANEAVDLAEDMAGIARDALEVAETTNNGLLELTRDSVAAASGAIAVAELMRNKLAQMPHGEVLNADELQAFAEAFPQWSVTAGMFDGRAVKTYQRIITAEELPEERRSGGPRERETYLSLADYEYSDSGLAGIFGSYGISGDYMNGKYYVVAIHSDEVGPITYADFDRVMQAEDYLHNAGYVQALPEPAAA